MIASPRTRFAASLCSLPLAALLAASSGAQESAARFDSPVVVATANERITDLIDFDADGAPDAVGWYDDRIAGFRNDGSGGFARIFSFEVELPQGTRIRQLRTGRLDADGREDFAFCFYRRIVAYSSNGAAEPSLLFDHLGVDDVSDFALADFDGDGLDDVVALLHSGTARTFTIKLYRNAGAGHLILADEEAFTTVLSDPRSLFIAEVNGNGRPDFGLVNDGKIHLFPLRGRALPEPIVLPLAMENEMPAAGDVDGDADEDIVFFGRRLSTLDYGYSILRRSGPEQFTPEAAVPGGPATKLADVDGDGDLDGVCCGGGGDGETDPNLWPSFFEIALNDGTGAFGAATRLPGLGSRRIAGAKDVDGDGDADLVGGRCVYYARGPIRGFDRPPVPYAGAIPAIPRPFVDCDSDGDLDFQFALGETCANRGDGTFAQRVPALLGAAPETALGGPGVAGDFDGDGDADLLVAAFDAGSGAFLGMRLLENTGCGALVDGGLGAPPGETVAEMADLALDPSLAVTIDVDGDGALDVVAQRRLAAPFRTRVWRNDSTGFLSPIQEFADEELKGAADMNGDGHADIVVRTPDAPFAGIRLGLGDGTFGPVSIRPGGLRPGFAFTLADFDGDGDVDIAGVSTNGIHQYVVLVNDGAAGFGESPSFGYEHGPIGAPTREPLLLPCDANGDGLLDMIARASNGDRHPVSVVFVRTSDGLSYEPPVTQVFRAVRAGDVDGDGDDDVLQAPFTLGTTVVDPLVGAADRIIPNLRIAPPRAGVRRQSGDGTPGTAGIAPILGVAGDLRPGFRPEYRLSGGRGGSVAILLIGTEVRNDFVRGGWLLVDPRWRRRFDLGGDAGEAGAGSFRFPSKPIAPGHAGLTFHFQSVVRDPEALEGWSFSNRLTATFGGVE